MTSETKEKEKENFDDFDKYVQKQKQKRKQFIIDAAVSYYTTLKKIFEDNKETIYDDEAYGCDNYCCDWYKNIDNERTYKHKYCLKWFYEAKYDLSPEHITIFFKLKTYVPVDFHELLFLGWNNFFFQLDNNIDPIKNITYKLEDNTMEIDFISKIFVFTINKFYRLESIFNKSNEYIINYLSKIKNFFSDFTKRYDYDYTNNVIYLNYLNSDNPLNTLNYFFIPLIKILKKYFLHIFITFTHSVSFYNKERYNSTYEKHNKRLLQYIKENIDIHYNFLYIRIYYLICETQGYSTDRFVGEDIHIYHVYNDCKESIEKHYIENIDIYKNDYIEMNYNILDGSRNCLFGEKCIIYNELKDIFIKCVFIINRNII
jgi:hypothetical protein